MNTLKEDNETLYQCGECALKYREEKTAMRCEAWCREHKSCNLDIIKDAVKSEEIEIKEKNNHAR